MSKLLVWEFPWMVFDDIFSFFNDFFVSGQKILSLSISNSGSERLFLYFWQQKAMHKFSNNLFRL